MSDKTEMNKKIEKSEGKDLEIFFEPNYEGERYSDFLDSFSARDLYGYLLDGYSSIKITMESQYSDGEVASFTPIMLMLLSCPIEELIVLCEEIEAEEDDGSDVKQHDPEVLALIKAKIEERSALEQQQDDEQEEEENTTGSPPAKKQRMSHHYVGDHIAVLQSYARAVVVPEEEPHSLKHCQLVLDAMVSVETPPGMFSDQPFDHSYVFGLGGYLFFTLFNLLRGTAELGQKMIRCKSNVRLSHLHEFITTYYGMMLPDAIPHRLLFLVLTYHDLISKSMANLKIKTGEQYDPLLKISAKQWTRIQHILREFNKLK